MGIHYFSYFAKKKKKKKKKKHRCRYSLEPPHRGGSDKYPQSMLWAEIWKISEFFIWKISFFGCELFNIFMNRRVFVMQRLVCTVCDIHRYLFTTRPLSVVGLLLPGHILNFSLNDQSNRCARAFILHKEHSEPCSYSILVQQLTLVIATLLISKNRYSWSENLVPVLIWNSYNVTILRKRRKIAPKEQFLHFSIVFFQYTSNFTNQITY